MRHKQFGKLSIALFFILSVLFTGCEEKSSSSSSQSVEQNDLLFSDETPAQTTATPESFTFNDTHGNSYTLFVNGKDIRFKTINRPLVMVHLFDINDQDALAQIPYLTQLEERYQGDILILAIPMNDPSPKAQHLNAFIKKHHINYIITEKSEHLLAQTLLQTLHESDTQKQRFPVTILYKDGSLYNSYEGAVPVEMMTYDIEEALKH